MLIRTLCGFLCTLLLNTVAFSAASPPNASDAERNAKIDAVFADYAKPGSPGCAVAVYQGSDVVFRGAYGMANLDHDIKLTPSTVFHVASVSKQFTATAILLLAQDGKLSLDDEVRKYIPELPDFGKKITIRHLAHHTSGIRDQWDLLNLAGWRYSRDLISDDDVLELLARQKDLNFTPGERHVYSNSGYTLMAVVVSRASGKSFREFTTERIFKPLGMTNTHFRDNFAEIVKNQAYGYAPDRGSFRLSVTNFDTAGATSLLTTVEDMARWHANFDSGLVGGEKLMAQLLERGTLNDGNRIEYAFGISHGRYRGVPTVGHGGSDAGYRADFIRFPEKRLGVATMCNIATANPGQLSRRVANVFLPADLPPADTEPAPDNSPEVAVAETTLKRYTGVYWSKENALARSVVLDGGKLHVVAGQQRIALKALGDKVFVMTGGPRNRLTFEEANGDVLLNVTGGPPQPLVRMDPFTPSAEQLEQFAGVYRSDEMDVVIRLSVKEGALMFNRTKMRPAKLDPTIKDIFRAPPGFLAFTRDAAGKVSGFTVESGRIKGVKFWRETSSVRGSLGP